MNAPRPRRQQGALARRLKDAPLGEVRLGGDQPLPVGLAVGGFRGLGVRAGVLSSRGGDVEACQMAWVEHVLAVMKVTILSIGRVLPVTLVAVVCAGVLPGMLHAGAPVTARQAVDHVQFRFGAGPLGGMVRVEGRGGVPQPGEWEVDVADASIPSGVRGYLANINGAVDRGQADGYPEMVPLGFFRWSSVQVDSNQAFGVAEVKAREARIGFDRVDYLLRAQEGTNNPLWSLTLVDIKGRPVGRIVLSAITGQVTRVMWFRYMQAGPRVVLQRVEDSASPVHPLTPVTPPPPVIPEPVPGPGGATPPVPPLPPERTSLLPPEQPLPPTPPLPTGGYEPLPPEP